MARSIERYGEPPLAHVTPALQLATQLRQAPSYWDFANVAPPPHAAQSVAQAIEQRAKFLPMFLRAEHARCVLWTANRWVVPDRKTAGSMIGAMLAAVGAKADGDILAGMLDVVLASDEAGIASGLWEPL